MAFLQHHALPKPDLGAAALPHDMGVGFRLLVAADAGGRKFVQDLLPEGIALFAQDPGGGDEIFRQTADGRQLEAGVRPPGVHGRAPVFGGNAYGQFQSPVLLADEHFLKDPHDALHEVEDDLAQILFIAEIVAVVVHHLDHPRGAGVVDAPGPEAPHAGAPVVHGVREHDPVVDADEILGVPPEFRQPVGQHLEDGFQVLRTVGAEGGPVAHFDIDVEVVIPGPGREAVVFEPGPLKSGGPAGRIGHGPELVEPVEVELLQVGVVEARFGDAPPVIAPPARVLFFEGFPVEGGGADEFPFQRFHVGVPGEAEGKFVPPAGTEQPETLVRRQGVDEALPVRPGDALGGGDGDAFEGPPAQSPGVFYFKGSRVPPADEFALPLHVEPEFEFFFLSAGPGAEDREQPVRDAEFEAAEGPSGLEAEHRPPHGDQGGPPGLAGDILGVRPEHFLYGIDVVPQQSGVDIRKILLRRPLHAAPVVPQRGTAEGDVERSFPAPHQDAQITVAEDRPGLDPGQRELPCNDVSPHDVSAFRKWKTLERSEFSGRPITYTRLSENSSFPGIPPRFSTFFGKKRFFLVFPLAFAPRNDYIMVEREGNGFSSHNQQKEKKR